MERAGRIEWQYTSVEDALNKLELVANGKLLNTAKMMFSTSSDKQTSKLTYSNVKAGEKRVIGLSACQKSRAAKAECAALIEQLWGCPEIN